MTLLVRYVTFTLSVHISPLYFQSTKFSFFLFRQHLGNGYFSLTMHALPAGWRTLSVCTSAFHMPRTQAIFNSCYSIAAADDFMLDYHPVSDDGLFSEEVLSARAVKEAAAVETWKKNVAEVHTLAELHRWLFATHLCYSVSRQHEFGAKENLDPKLAATY